MNQIKTYLTMGGCLLAMALTTACDDRLSALPSQSKVDDNLIVDQKSAEYALNGIYYMYAQCGTDYYDVLSTGCTYTQEIYPANFAGAIVYYQGAYMLENHDQTADNSTVLNLWSTFYSQLAAANGVLKQMEAAPDDWFSGDRKAEIMGEACFMRALVHYQLLRWFARYWDIDSPYGVLLRTEPVLAGSIAKDRSTVKDSYACILNDLEYAITHMAAENPNHYANVWVAKGLKARVLMMRGQGTDYADAAALAQDIIDHGPYELESNVQDIFYVKGLESREVMFGIQPKDNQTDVLEAYYYRQVPNFYPTAKLDSIFGLIPGDTRKEWLFPQVKLSQSQADIDAGKEPKYATLICKHMPADDPVATTVEESQYQMRLTEMYLLRAEALVRSGGDRGEAGRLLKEVLSHAGVTDFTRVEEAATDEALLTEIFYETLRNLFCESGRELEIMMRMPEAVVLDFNPIYKTGKDYAVFPIPADEFKNNTALKEQNPGYTKV